ncbi:MAG: LysR family transcriptional regulator [Proteobacteria bacterium]|nr:LysR family transcriptional regulator [Pseudomonadota bacterium]MBU1058702.1 LysR family transcriptional regulator [Pseudomonadota bacterium]
MELRQLKTFLVVAELLSFNQAADALNFAQSTVSARIRALEEELGVPLFDRLGKKVALTEAGRIMVRYARKMADMEAETFAEVAGWEGPGGSISVRMPQSLGTYLLPRVLVRFQQQYPRVNLDINTCTFSTLKQELRSGITDMAFLLMDTIHEASLKSEILGFVNLLFICSSTAELSRRKVVRLEDMEQQTLLLPKYDCRYKSTFLQDLAELKVTPAAVLEINSIETIKACVEQGVGVTLLPEIAVQEELAQGRFASFQFEGESLETAILLILHKDKWLSQSMEAFIEEVRTCFC